MRPVSVMRGHDSPIASVQFSPDSARLLTVSTDNSARLWNVATGEPIGGNLGTRISASFSPDGTRIVTGSFGGVVQIWDGITGTAIGSLPGLTSKPINYATFSPDGTRIAAGSAGSVTYLYAVSPLWTMNCQKLIDQARSTAPRQLSAAQHRAQNTSAPEARDMRRITSRTPTHAGDRMSRLDSIIDARGPKKLLAIDGGGIRG